MRATTLSAPETVEAEAQPRLNRRQAAKLLKISYKAFLNKLKALEEEKQVLKSHPGA